MEIKQKQQNCNSDELQLKEFSELFEHIIDIINRYRKAKISKENDLELWKKKKEDLQERIGIDDVKQGISDFLLSHSQISLQRCELELEQDQIVKQYIQKHKLQSDKKKKKTIPKEEEEEEEKQQQSKCQCKQTHRQLEISYNVNELKDKKLLVIGQTGVGKSEFIKLITQNMQIKSGNSTISVTNKCEEYKVPITDKCLNQQVISLIDTPGINDTKQDQEIILLKICDFIEKQNIDLKDIFIIYISENDLKLKLKFIRDLIIMFYLKLISKDIKDERNILKEIQILKAIKNSFSISEQLLDVPRFLQDNNAEDQQIKGLIRSTKERIIDYKDLIRNNIEYLDIMSIFVRTKFDTKGIELKFYDEQYISYFNMQLWSSKIQDQQIQNKLLCYSNYLKDQQEHLFTKIHNIICTFEKVQKDYLSLTKVLVLGPSQVGKSSLIEQIVRIEGIRGTGEQSETEFCKMYMVQQDQGYIFIDTPGFQGTEKGKDTYDNFKIIADYLRRYKIYEFKIIYIHHSNNPRKQQINTVLDNFNLLISQYCFKDVSFLGKEALNYLQDEHKQLFQMNKLSQDYQKSILKQQIIFINRYDIGESYSNKKENQYTQNDIIELINGTVFLKFQSFIYIRGIRYTVDKNLDRLQNLVLFGQLNQKIPITFKESTVSQILKLGQNPINKICSNEQEEEQKIHILKQLINKLNELDKNKEDYLQTKKKLMQELQEKQIIVFFNENKQDLQPSEILKDNNRLADYVTFINYNTILYEDNQFFIQHNTKIDKKLYALSKMQQYYGMLSNNLKEFRFQKQTLTNLAAIQLMLEFQQTQQYQQEIANKFYQEGSNTISEAICHISKFTQHVVQTGISSYNLNIVIKMMITDLRTVYGQSLKASLSISRAFGLIFNSLLAVISVGLDVYSFISGKQGGAQFGLNLTSNIVSAAGGIIILLLGATNPIGWVLMGLSAIGSLFIGLLFTSSNTFDKVIKPFLTDLVSEHLENNQLYIFQQTKLLDKLGYSNQNYNDSIFYEKCRQFEKEIQYDKQKNIERIFFQSQQQNDLNRQISQQIMKTIVKKIQDNHNQQFYKEREITFHDLEISVNNKLFLQNQMLLDTFFNRLKYKGNCIGEELQTQLKQIQKQAENIIKNKKQQNQFKITEIVDQQYYQNFNQFLRCFQDSQGNFTEIKNYSISEFQEMSNGFWRSDKRFMILYNYYKNILYEKILMIHDQDIIKGFQKNEIGGIKCYQLQLKDYTTSTTLDDKWFEDNVYENLFKNEETLLKYVQLFSYCNMFIDNRYYQTYKEQNQAPSLSSSSKRDNFNSQLNQEHDLKFSKQQFQSFEQFFESKKNQLKSANFQAFIQKNENQERLKQFYQGLTKIHEMKDKFQDL